MGASQVITVPELIDKLKHIIVSKESCILTMLTDSRRSVLMRFSDGILTSARCRSWEIAFTIEALIEAKTVKLTVTSARAEDKPEVMHGEDFLNMINPGDTPIDLVSGHDTRQAPETFPEQIETEPAREPTANNKVSDQPAHDETVAEEQTAEVEKSEQDVVMDREVAARTNYF